MKKSKSSPKTKRLKKSERPMVGMGEMSEKKIYINPRTKIMYRKVGNRLEYLKNGQWTHQPVNAEYLMGFSVREY